MLQSMTHSALMVETGAAGAAPGTLRLMSIVIGPHLLARWLDARIDDPAYESANEPERKVHGRPV